jgi:hypothetical protein
MIPLARWQIAVLTGLFALPLGFLLAMGGYTLWERGWWFWAWFPMAVCIGTAYYLAYRWQQQFLVATKLEPEFHWTERDKSAMQIVEQHAQRAQNLTMEQLAVPQFYFEQSMSLAGALAKFYHPHAVDPYGHLTIPEMLAVAELAAADLDQLVRTHLPAGHLLTLNDVRRAQVALKHYQAATNVAWAAGLLFNPAQTAIRYLANHIGLTLPLQKLQQNVVLWFYTMYIQRLGTYLIDLNSGRLRVGAKRYRELKAAHQLRDLPTAPPAETTTATATPPSASAGPSPAPVTLAVCGQTKMGKSSLINALLGEQRAAADVVPLTAEITRYVLNPSDAAKLTVLDTVGYGHEGPKADQLRATEDAARQADFLLLILHARNPGRQADMALLDRLREWFAHRPELKMPPVLAVLTHVDLLTPAMEWAPPYQWRTGTRPKEQAIAAAVATVREQFGDRLADVVPVCTAVGKLHGIEEELWPTLVAGLDEARAVSFLRCVKSEADEGKFRKVFEQVLAVGKQAAALLWQKKK